MINIRRGLFRVYIVVLSTISIVTLLNLILGGGWKTDALWYTLLTLAIFWIVPLIGYRAVMWTIQGFRGRR